MNDGACPMDRSRNAPAVITAPVSANFQAPGFS